MTTEILETSLLTDLLRPLRSLGLHWTSASKTSRRPTKVSHLAKQIVSSLPYAIPAVILLGLWIGATWYVTRDTNK